MGTKTPHVEEGLMKRVNTIAIIQMGLGVAGLVLCYALYLHYGGALRRSLDRIAEMADEVHRQAEIGNEVLADWTGLLEGFDDTLSTHRQTLATARTANRQVSQSIGEWRVGLTGTSKVASHASLVCLRFAKQLPVRLPEIEVDTREVRVDIPQFNLKQETVKIPYPTAQVGTREVSVDLGLTDLKVEVPTLTIGSRSQRVVVPAPPEVTHRRESFSVPEDLRIQYREILTDEKRLLEDTGQELERTALLLDSSTETLETVRRLLDRELAESIDATDRNLQQSQASLRRSYADRLPEFRRRLLAEQVKLTQSQDNFRSLKSLVPWLFGLAALLPAAIVLHGCQSWRRAVVDERKLHAT